MTPRRGPTRSAAGDWKDYLSNAEQLLDGALEMLDLSDGDSRAKAAALNAVHAAIAFGDSLTVARLGVTNAQDHGQLTSLVAQAAGKSVDDSQIARLKRILAKKDQADYGPRQWRRDEADALIQDVERFGNWIRSVLT
jgi:hypothetical protein